MERKSQVIDYSKYARKSPIKGGGDRFEGNLALQEANIEGPVTGFNSLAEVRSFKRNLARGVSATDCFKELEENAKTWRREYAVGDKVFIGHYKITELGIVDQSGLPVRNKISPKERQGKVLSCWEEGEQRLLKGKDGDMWVSVSPVGPTGLEDESGNPINFVDTYIQVAFRKGNDLKFITFRAGLDIYQSRRLLLKLIAKYDSDLEIPNLGRSALEESSNIVDRGVFITEDQASPADLIWEIASINKSAFYGLVEGQMYRQLQEAEEKFSLDRECQSYVDELKQFVFSNLERLDESGFEQLFEEKIKQMLIKITLSKPFLSSEDIKQAMVQIRKFSGCAGSGGDSRGVVQLGDLVFVETLGGFRLASTQEQWADGTCSVCNKPGKISCHMCKSCADKK